MPNKKMSRSHRDKSPEIRELKDQWNPERVKDAAQLVASTRQLCVRVLMRLPVKRHTKTGKG